MTGGKYGAFVRVALRRSRRSRGELYGRIVFFVIILGVFSSLWRAVSEAGMPIAASPGALVWYLAITEWIVLSAPLMHIDVQEAVRRGDVVCQLARPASWVAGVCAEGVGLLLSRAPALFVTACLTAYAFSGWMPHVGVLAVVLPLGLAAATLAMALNVGIGLLAFWLGDVGPVSWLWQKLLFVFGGLLMPIELYPAVVRRVAPYTPFPSMLSRPASFVLTGDVGTLLVEVRDLAIWGGVAALVLHLVFRKASRALTVNGG